MLIVLGLYGLLVFLIFGRLKLLPWTTPWKVLVSFIGLVIALVVIGALNYLAPSGRVTVQGATVEITPNVSGTVTDVHIEPNVPIGKGELLFRIDPAPFAAEVARLEAAVVDAQSQAEGLRAELETAEAEIDRLEAQLEFAIVRRDDLTQLAERGATNEFQMQDAISHVEQLRASLNSAKAQRDGVEIRIASVIDGRNSVVVQAEQALVGARWNLEQTEVFAPADGMVTALSLRPGQRVTAVRPAVAFLPYERRILTAVFSQTAAHAFELGSEVMVAMQALPGSSLTTTVDGIVPGTADGTLGGATGSLPSVSQLMGSDQFVVRLAIPEGMPEHALLLGMSGSAMRITDEAGPIEPLAKILFWLQKMFNYL